jgi:hypothetical protein
MSKNLITAGLVAFTILLNCFLVYFLMWNPYSLYFDRPEFSHTPYTRRESYAGLTALFNFLFLLILTILMIRSFNRKRRFFILAPLFSGLTLFLLLYVQAYYPDSVSQYTKDGFQFMEQTWYLDNNHLYKRFKSDRPVMTYSDSREIVWQLDSISKRK